MEYKKYDCNSYQIHTIKTDKFKTVRMEIVFSREVEKEKLPIFTFLSDILSDASKNYKSRKELAIRLEELYKTLFYGVTNKVGNLFTLSFILEFIDPVYIKEKDYLENVLALPFQIINNPRVKNKEFDLINFNIVKKRLLEEIESIKEDASKLAITSSLEAMDNTSPSSYKIYGTKEDIENITPASLYKAYIDLFEHSNCDIFIIGNTDMDKVVKIIQNNFVNHVIKVNKPNPNVLNKVRKKPLIKNEKSNFSQSTLVMVYNIKDLDKKMKDTTFHVFNYMLGAGGITSKLYQSLRCQNSLCYAVKSLYLKYDGLLIIEVSLDKENVNKAKDIILKDVKTMIKGEFTLDELNEAKKNLLFSLKMSSDNNASIINNYIFYVFDNLPLITERSKMINDVTKEDIEKCAKSLVLNTVYIQDGEE